MFKPSSTTSKPWGQFRQFSHNEETTVKILEILQGETLSLQLHYKRKEYWYIIEGDPLITKGEREFKAHPGDEIFIEQGEKHRISAPDNKVRVLEIAYGHFSEHEDTVRLEDKYNRN